MDTEVYAFTGVFAGFLPLARVAEYKPSMGRTKTIYIPTEIDIYLLKAWELKLSTLKCTFCNKTNRYIFLSIE